MASLIKILCIVLTLSTITMAKKKLPSLEELEKASIQYLYIDREEISVEKVDTTLPLYYAYAYITLDIPFDEAAPYILDFDHYEEFFDNIVDVHRIIDKRWPKDSIYYIEAKSRVLEGFGLGVVDKVTEKDGESIYVKVRPAPRRLTYEYRNLKKEELKWYVKDVYVDCMLVKYNENQCRVGFRGISSANKHIPLWIANVAMNIVFPKLMHDLEKRIIKDRQYPRYPVQVIHEDTK